mmetsp:Transcript_21555/g.23509  ORF Transcript_21555/g.23509 Transcript_21555/m.23509 type:complete len:594 (-) Transcript_21555:83-1864(-)
MFWKSSGLVCVLFWSLLVLHLQVFFFRSFSTARAYRGDSKVSSCPFKVAHNFLRQPTAFIANSLFSVSSSLDRGVSSVRGLSMHVGANSWKQFHHFHDYGAGSGWSDRSSPSTNRCYFTGSSLKAVTSPSILVEDVKMPVAPSIEETRKKKKKNLESLEVIVIGLSHHNAKVEVREKLAVPEQNWNEVSAKLVNDYDSIAEASVLSTCNRFEIYLAGSNQYEVIKDAMQFLMEYSNRSVDPVTLRRNLFMLSGEDAIWHLLRVSAGLDSLIVGEGQILAQVKKCYEHGTEAGNPAGKVISRLLNNAVAAGKRVRSETGISKGAVSISSAAAEFTALKLEEDCKLTDMKDAHIAIIGAGKMARLLLIHLETQGVTKVTIINRSFDRIIELQKEFPNIEIEMKLMDDMWEVLSSADVCYPSTAATSTIIDPEPLRAALTRRQKSSALQFVDISVPRNVHADCAFVEGVKCYNVDDLKAVVERNTAKRRREMVEAENILRDELSKFRLWQQSLGAIPTIAKLQEKAENLRKEEMLKAAKKLSTLNAKDLEVVEKVTKGIVAKLLHGPMSHLRQQTEGDATRAAIQQVQLAFQLEQS